MLWLFILLISILLIIELLSLARWISYPFYPSPSYGDPSWLAVHVETALFYLPAAVAPIVLVVAMFSWLVIPLRRYLASLRVQVRIGQWIIRFGGRKTNTEQVAKSEILGRRFSVLVLACSVALTSFIALYPYLPSVNPDAKLVGIDIPHYERWVGWIEESKGINVVPYAFARVPDRPLGILLMFGLRNVTGSSLQTVLKFTPLILGPCLILTMFYFVFEATKNWILSSLTALISAFSYHVTLGMLGAFFSNWMALVGVYFFSGFLIRAMRLRSWRWSFLAASTLILVSFTHAYTWGMLIGVLGVYALSLILLVVRGKAVQWQFKVVGAIVAGNIAVDVVRNWLLGSPGLARETLRVAGSTLALEFLGQFWANLTGNLHSVMGGFFMNPILLFLFLLGAFLVCLRNKPVDQYLFFWLIPSSVLLLFANWVTHLRILYNLPVTVFAAFGLDYVRRRLESLDVREAKILGYLFILFVVLMSANYGFRCAHYLLEAFIFE